MKAIAVILLGLLMSCFSHAESLKKGIEVRDKHILGVNVNLSGGFYFSTVDKIQNPGDCSNESWYQLADLKFKKEAFLLIKSAYSNKEAISFYINGCKGNYPKVEYVYVGGYQKE